MPVAIDREFRESEAIRALTRRLVVDYADQHSAAYVESAVAQAWGRLATARVRSFIMIFVERFAREVLDRPHQSLP